MTDPNLVQQVLTVNGYGDAAPGSAMYQAVDQALTKGVPPDVVGSVLQQPTGGSIQQIVPDLQRLTSTYQTYSAPSTDPGDNASNATFAPAPSGSAPSSGAPAAGTPGTDPFAQAMHDAGWTPTPKQGVWLQPETGKTWDQNDPSGAKGAGSAASIAAGAQYASIAENARQFNASLADKQQRYGVEDEQWQKTYDRSQAQFDKTFDRNSFENDRTFQQAKDQFSTKMAEDQREYNATFGENQWQYDTSLQNNQAQFAATYGLNLADTSAKYGLQAESMALDNARFNRTQSLEEQKNRQDILSKPSDFVARAFESRGGVSPETKVTHADLINAVNTAGQQSQAEGDAAVANARAVAAKFAAMPGYTAPAMAPRPASPGFAPAAAAPAAGPDNTPGWTPTPGGGTGSMPNAGVNLNAGEIAAGAQWAPTPANGVPLFAKGGATQDNAIVTGDSPDGKENEELVIDLPNDGGLMVIPKKNLIGKRKRQASQPSLAATFAAAPHAATGGIYDTNNQDWLSGNVTQDQITGAAKDFAPPAITNLVNGQPLANFRPAEASLTPRKVGMMTTSEQAAFNSYLGVVDNTTLQDELDGTKPVFGPSVNSPRATMGYGGR